MAEIKLEVAGGDHDDFPPAPSHQKETNKLLLKWCLVGNSIIIVLMSIAVFCVDRDVVDTTASNYLRAGWNDSLNIIGISIDTAWKYLVAQVFIALVEILDVGMSEIAYPIITLVIYNEDKKIIDNFSRRELQVCANLTYLLSNIRAVLTILVSVAQIDIAILRVIYGQILSMCAINRMLKHKTFITRLPTGGIEE